MANLRPICPVHYVFMTAYASRSAVTYYRCQVQACCETSKRLRQGDIRAFDAPQMCPKCSSVLRISSTHGDKSAIIFECSQCQILVPIGILLADSERKIRR